MVKHASHAIRLARHVVDIHLINARLVGTMPFYPVEAASASNHSLHVRKAYAIPAQLIARFAQMRSHAQPARQAMES